MAQVSLTQPIGRRAGATITAKRFVKLGTDPASQCAVCGANEAGVGVALGAKSETFAAGRTVDIGVLGIFEVEASAAIAAGAWVGSAANGKAVTAPTTAGTKEIMGRALTAAGADGDVIEVLMGQHRDLVDELTPQVAIADFTMDAGITAATANGALVGSAGANPTQAEFNELAKEFATKINDVLAKLRSAGVIAAS